MVQWMWGRGMDPDNFSIPYLTALGDLLGTGLLALCFHILWLIGDRDTDVGDWKTPQSPPSCSPCLPLLCASQCIALCREKKKKNTTTKKKNIHVDIKFLLLSWGPHYFTMREPLPVGQKLQAINVKQNYQVALEVLANLWKGKKRKCRMQITKCYVCRDVQ